ncbi:MAG: hypothetical protein KAQ88_06895, partial [Hyphomicrobiaceae bacterium]|nr:hypothetical protein [Hyphomicrobiaceae bacterium]
GGEYVRRAALATGGRDDVERRQARPPRGVWRLKVLGQVGSDLCGFLNDLRSVKAAFANLG